ncbi:MAG: DUF1883 domain-containing protein [Bacteriovoracaceae bacterium]|jgi:hypothetical protein|nr:DUF1883 domain-containing protein [Bacteriovoracaceae bacterium]
MKYLYKEIQTAGSDAIQVDLTGNAANVMVMDAINFSNYKAGRRYRYSGGHYSRSPAIINPPHAGRWFVIVDLGGLSGRVDASIGII